MNPTFIFVDGSYYCFYRFHALKNWWKNAQPDEPLKVPIENEKFVEKFKKTFVENLSAISRKLKLHKNTSKPILVVARDCKRENIWRMKLYPKYKGSRKTDTQIGPFFQMVYQ
jgi:5'-3' exonuclease